MLAIILLIIVFGLLPRRRFWGWPHGMYFGGYHRPPHHPGFPPFDGSGPREPMGGPRGGGHRF